MLQWEWLRLFLLWFLCYFFILLTKIILGNKNNKWNTIQNFIQLAEKNFWRYLGFIVLGFILFFLVYQAYVFSFLYIFKLETISYPIRLMLAFSFIVPISAVLDKDAIDKLSLKVRNKLQEVREN